MIREKLNPPQEIASILPRFDLSKADEPLDQVYLHYFFIPGGIDWYVTHGCYDEQSDDWIFQGWAVQQGEYACVEWGSFALSQLKDICRGAGSFASFTVERDLHFTPQRIDIRALEEGAA